MVKKLFYRLVDRSPILISLRERYWHTKHRVIWKFGHYRSLLERSKNIEHYIRSNKIRKLQVGCWPYLREGWLNTELYGSRELIPLNLLKPLPIPRETIDYIFSEHVHEHFNFDEGQYMLKEFFRVLRKGGKIRIATPNLLFLVNLYQHTKTPVQKKYIKWSSDLFIKNELYTEAMIINNFVRAWGHQFIYDFETLKTAVEMIGFTNVTLQKPGESRDKHLKNLESHWKSTSKEFNNLETFVLEATK